MHTSPATLFVLTVIAVWSIDRTTGASEVVDFDGQVAPLLAVRCLECHNATEHEGDLDLSDSKSALRTIDAIIVPGELANSLLWKQVKEDVMPPKHPLSQSEKRVFQAWIENGAVWGKSDPIDRFAYSTDTRAGADWWSLKPVQRPVPPMVEHQERVNNPIDAFVMSRLSSKQLSLAPLADRRTLIRRLYFDLVGLPPTRQEIEKFVNDPAQDAYAKLIDRLLASQHYGERWARHWLDVARYTESQGFEYDRFRPNAWHYRDYVIDALNSDKPYDVFAQEQIAGDAVNFSEPGQPPSSGGIIATSLLVCGPWDQAGNSQANVTQKMITREEELEDLVSVVSQTFLGMTVNCARCHSHKFDPILQADYYQMKAVFEGVRHGERQIDIGVTYAGTRKQPEPTHRLVRGDVKLPAEVVRPTGLSIIKFPPSDLGLSEDAPEAERRVAFARWLTDPNHPLTARVIVNRLWHYHFGRGIVESPNDFGFNGARPSHPELLDWLASEFVNEPQRWSIKKIHRMILMSATYQQSSILNEKAATIDADNTLLWRFAPRRLEGEIVRDAMLAVSDQLNRSVGGPSFLPFIITRFNSDFYQPIDPLEADFQRRTVYRAHINSGKSVMLDSLDCPDPSIKTPSRRVTTTPLAALALMNNSFVLRQAHHLSERVKREAEGDTGKSIELAFQTCFGRSVKSDELQAAATLVAENGMESLCWALLNSTEFIYVH
jgi:hypothetical protein